MVVLTAIDWIILIFKFSSIGDAPTVGLTHWADPLAFALLAYVAVRWWNLRQGSVMRDALSAWMCFSCGVGIIMTFFGGCLCGLVIAIALMLYLLAFRNSSQL